MSRSYYEFKEAQWAYHEKMAARTLDNPKEAVVYTWASSNPYWERRRQLALSNLNAPTLGVEERKKIAGGLLAMGKAEEQKERAFMKAACPDFNFDNLTTRIEFIKKFNEILAGKEQFEKTLDRLRAVINQRHDTVTKEIKDEDGNITTKEVYKQQLAPVISSTYLSYLGTALNAEISQVILKLDLMAPFEEWTEEINEAITKAIDIAFEKMTTDSRVNKEQDQLYGDADTWKEYYTIYKSIPDLRNRFQNMIRNKIDFDNLSNELLKQTDILKKVKNNNKKSGLRTFLDSPTKKGGLNLKNRTAQVGGSVYEFIDEITALLSGSGTVSENGANFNIAARTLTGEMSRTDVVRIYDFSSEHSLNINQMIKDLDDTLISSKGLTDAAKRIQDFYDRNLANLKDGFIIYESNKAYGLGTNFRGFQNGQTMTIDRINDFLGAADMAVSNINDFTHAVYNTTPGAQFEDKQNAYQKRITLLLYQATAQLLFDDWVTIGNEMTQNSGNALHVFSLSGVYVPISYILINLGNALQQADKALEAARSYVSINVTMPHSDPVYEPDDWKDWKDAGSKDADIKQRIYDAWNEQISQSKAESTFTIHFLTNMIGLITLLTT